MVPFRVDRWLLQEANKIVEPVGVHIELRSNALTTGTSGRPTIRVMNGQTLAHLLFNPDLSFGDAYTRGSLEIDGDLVSVLERLFECTSRVPKWISRLKTVWLRHVQANSLRGSRRNIRHHYDLPTDFYQLWLDRELIYTCAYFPERQATLEEAQQAKLKLICKKLWLKAGETMVEAGCGWGALSLYMAREYGVRVKAYNISHEQIVFARNRAREQGLSGEVEFIEDDYRNIHGHFDAFVSVGMLEHVGVEHYRDLGRIIHKVIGDSGRGLLHFIGRNFPKPINLWIQKRIFPGAYPPSLREALEVFEAQDFSVLDIENLRPHYALTLRHWLDRFEYSYDLVAGRRGEEFARMWRLYLAGSMVAFNLGTLQLFQVVFAGHRCSTVPWTRNDGKRAIERKPMDDVWIPAMC